jgi:hypothetical protein
VGRADRGTVRSVEKEPVGPSGESQRFDGLSGRFRLSFLRKLKGGEGTVLCYRPRGVPSIIVRALQVRMEK